MIKIDSIYETKEVVIFLQKRWLTKQYKKAKENILQGNNSGAVFKLMKPKKNKIYTFRLNRQFRAFCRFTSTGKFLVYEVSNHQNF